MHILLWSNIVVWITFACTILTHQFEKEECKYVSNTQSGGGLAYQHVYVSALHLIYFKGFSGLSIEPN